ncbi:hypothetical protein FHR83_005357 [Actinoplanes campanulatus]|uniref:Helicase ATP-binding domain-containing protein n=1 Tax=Actinoplanes campanulatus TaxID=113559 RepID=A0A7W5FGJ4_9ACTN|nr:hypothetical protein [Actinoplanes campanulatus]MBB3097673.1 hypothetical protein [Actinoplanes campanulatus]GGN37706.1 hypothetical protein GCM10010109_63920 [Actinoplanes campanulatus]GID39762.1 hypothetical protein Aca09nite_62680 [Actinoplanes campanulatus]
MTTTRLRLSDGTILAALALAAHYFPTPTPDDQTAAGFTHASFFLGGHYTAWSTWPDLPHTEKQRIAAVLAAAPEELATAAVFTRRARNLLKDPGDHPFRLAGNDPDKADAAIGMLGGDPLGYVDRLLDRLRRDHRRRRPQDVAQPGQYLTKTHYASGHGLVQGRTTIPLAAAPAPPAEHPHVNTVPRTEHIRIDTDALLKIAADIDTRYPQGDAYLHRVLHGLLKQVNTKDSISVSEAIRLMSGPMEIFNAPTGTGKSVFVRVAASWFALNKMRVALVMPNVDATLSTAWDIIGDLQHLAEIYKLDDAPTCTPLMSPNGLFDRAIKAVARIEGTLLEQPPKTLWRLDQLSYGCALDHLTEVAHPIPRGRETCRSLTPLPPAKGPARACPWMPSACDKYTQPRQACTAAVVVTNHHNFMVGRFHLDVTLDGTPTADLSIAEFLLRGFHTVMIDEVDQFQSTALDMCASELVLDTRRNTNPPPLRALDADAARLPIESQKDLCPTISHVRYLAEFLLSSICSNEINLRYYQGQNPATDRANTSTGWHLAHGRDRRLIMLLFPDANITDERDVPAELFTTLNTLWPAHPGADDDGPHDNAPPLPSALVPVRTALARLLAPRGEDLLTQVKIELGDILQPVIADAHDRSEAIELLIVRAWLHELDNALGSLRNKAAQLRSVGLQSARQVAERLESSIGGTILPHGMLGKAIVGYRVTGLDDANKNAELTVQYITGDPHTYTAQLGSIVALALAGTERPVIGLSATAYFPQAVREHIHSTVKWWMTDAEPDTIRARRQLITDAVTNQAITISGLPQAHKRRALIALGEQLYDNEIHDELARITARDPDRARAAVVVNSYEHCRYIAMGIHGAGKYTGGLCVASPPDADRRDKLPALPPGVTELTPEEFEAFPQRGTILVVPMARIARGLNIVVGTKSAITPVYLCTRPLALMTDPPEMYASINAAGINTINAAQDPLPVLHAARQAAWERLGMIMRSAPGFVAAAPELQEEIVAGMVIDMIQLAGRARRGGTNMTLHLVDHAFHEDSWQADLGNILRRMHAKWHPAQRRQMNAIYREALGAFMAYAGIDTTRD